MISRKESTSKIKTGSVAEKRAQAEEIPQSEPKISSTTENKSIKFAALQVKGTVGGLERPDKSKGFRRGRIWA